MVCRLSQICEPVFSLEEKKYKLEAMQGRPQLFANSRQISVLVSADDYKLLNNMVENERVARPGYSFGVAFTPRSKE